MKNILKTFMLSFIISMVFASSAFAQDPPPPPGGGHGGGGALPPGGGAPVGEGIVLLISLAAGYGAKRVFNARKRLAE